MSRLILAEGLELSGGDRGVVAVVAVVALAALAVGYVLLREVLAAGQGTPTMQDIARAVQEGAAAYLNRQFRTLGVFVVIVFLLLFLLPADDVGERVGRSLFFVVGAGFSAAIGYLGMWLSTRANVRVAAAAREERGRERAMRVAFRTGGVVGMTTVGLGPCSARPSSCSSTRARRRRCWRASGSAPRCWRCSCGWAAASSPRRPTSARTWSARWSRTSPRTTRATRPRSPTTWATTWATAREWRRTCSSPMRSRWSPR
nr:hypothetical protein GCM10020241_33140 [Streptoalloteichus tenebrarius]